MAKEFKRAVHGIALTQAHNCLAYIYGFANWNELLFAVQQRDADAESESPDPPLRFLFDEDLEPEALEARRNFQARSVHEWLSLDAERSRDLILQLRPSAGMRDAQVALGVESLGDTSAGEPHEVEVEKSLDTEEEDDLDSDQDVVDRPWRFVPSSMEVPAPRYWKIKKLMPGLTKREAQRALAFMYGFRGWTELKDAIESRAGNGIQRVVDEGLRLDELDERRAFQARRAQKALDLDMPSSRALVQLLKPSAAQRPQSARNLATDALSVDEEYDERIWRRLNRE